MNFGCTSALKLSQKPIAFWEWGMGNGELAHKVFLLHIRCSHKISIDRLILDFSVLKSITNCMIKNHTEKPRQNGMLPPAEP